MLKFIVLGGDKCALYGCGEEGEGPLFLTIPAA